MYTARTILNRNKYLLALLIMWVGVMCFAEGAKAQTVIYGQYVGPAPANTGGSGGAGGSAGLGGSVGVTGSYSIVNPTYLNDAIYTNYAEVKATSGAPGSGLGAGNGAVSTAYMNVNFTGATTPLAGNPIIIKMDALANSTTTPLTKISLQAYNNTTAVGSSVLASTLAVNAAGDYIFVPTGNCNSVRITVTTDQGSTLLGIGNNTATAAANVYYAYIYDPSCNIPYYTTFTTGGVSLGAGVSQPNNAIDGNVSTASTLSFGVLGLGASITQKVYFSAPTGTGDAVTVTISKSAALLSLDLLNGITVSAYNGSNPTAVWTANVGALLSLDLLGLLANPTPYSVTIPGNTQPFNRVELTLNSLAAVLSSLNLNEVQITPPKPTFTSPLDDTVYICPGNTATLAVDAPASGNIVRWYATAAATDMTVLNTGATYVTPALSANTTYWVATKKSACTPESERVPVRVLMNTLPTAPSFAGPITVCKDSTKALTVSSPATNTVYRWYSVNSGGTAFFTGNTYTTSALAADTTIYVDAYNTVTGCVSSGRTAVTISVTTVPNTVAASQTICSGGTPVAFTSTLPTTAGTNTLQWQQSTDSVNFIAASGTATGITYAPPALTQTTFYRRVTTLTGCASRSNVLKITVSPLPTITAGSTIYSCLGDNSVALPYTATTGSPNQYSITWTGSPAGLPNVTNATLTGTSGIMTLTIQAAAVVGVYNGVLTVKNASCTSTNYNFSLTIQAHPSVTPVNTSYQ